MAPSILTEEDKEKGPTGGFKVRFPYEVNLEEARKRELEDLAHRELYRLWVGEEAAPGAALAVMRAAIEKKAGKTLDIRLEVVLVDEDRKAASFASGLKKIERFLPESKNLFICHAIETLAEIGVVRHPKGSQENKDKFKLCCALLEAEEHWENNREAFEALCRNPKLASLVESARNAIENNNDSSTTKIYYGGHDEREHDRDRDQGRS